MDMKKVLQIFSKIVFWGTLCLVLYVSLDESSSVPFFWAITWSVLMVGYMMFALVYYICHMRHQMK